MKGDFTRDTFERAKHFSRVLMQQGRVTLDADSNEQAAILLHYMRTLAKDLIGPYGAPAEGGGFELSGGNDILNISKGRYYVDGILVENEEDCTYRTQPDYTPTEDNDALLRAIKNNETKDVWLYLDVWERHITPLEDGSIREKALGGADTCTRTKVVWQVKAYDPNQGIQAAAPAKKSAKKQSAQLTKTPATKAVGVAMSCEDLISKLQRDKPKLAARVDPGFKSEDPCIISPAAKYRGAENQLYRVEIHQGGNAGRATFKWSRDNGCVATALLGRASGDFALEVANARGFSAGDWVELSEDTMGLREEPGLLVKLAKVEGNVLTIDQDSIPPDVRDAWNKDLWEKNFLNPKVRRWDQIQTGDIVLDQGAVPVQESPSALGQPVWIDLEDGVQIRFGKGGEYRTGDYWLIPARVATGSIEWPVAATGGNNEPESLVPHGVEHHYAPLDYVTIDNGNIKDDINNSCRCKFYTLSQCGD